MKKFSNRDTKRLLGLAFQEKSLLFFGFLALCVGSGVNLFLPQVLRDWLNSENPAQQFQFFLVLLVILFVLQGVSFYLRSLFFGIVGQRSVAGLRERLFSKILSRKISFFDKHNSADLLSRLHADTTLIQDAVSIRLSVLVRYALQVLVGTILMFLISPKLSFLLLLVLPLLVGMSMVLGKRLKAASKLQQEALAEANVVAEEDFALVRSVKAFVREAREEKRYDRVNSQVLAAGITRTKIAAFFASFVSSLMNLALALVAAYGAYLVSTSELPIGDLGAFLLYGLIVGVSFAFFTGSFSELSQAMGATERVFELLEAEDKENEYFHSGERNCPEKNRWNLRFDKVSFRYPERPEQVVIKGISFDIHAGKTTALVGPSGAGKSTIVSLLLRFYEPDSGLISLDGRSLQEFELSRYRESIAVVPQNPELFSDTLRNNLLFAKPSANDEEILEALRRAQLETFLKDLPKGLETNIGERGLQLSGGQKQRLAIARALLLKPSFIILDEATSSLDTENERLIQLALAELFEDTTALVIAHRLSTVQNADQLLVLDSGNLVEQGQHKELMKGEGLYQRLVESQALL